MAAPDNLSGVALTPGSRIQDYEILSEVRGSFAGSMYRARRTGLLRWLTGEVVLRLVNLDPDDSGRQERLADEIRRVVDLRDRTICRVRKFGRLDDATYFLAYETFEGSALRDALAHRRLSLRSAVHYGAQIARGLAAAHRAHIVHGCLNPGSLVLEDPRKIRILDWGVGGAMRGSSVFRTRDILESLRYAAPEQLQDRSVGPSTDVFAAGTVLYELLAGRPAFARNDVRATMHAILTEEPPPIESPVGAASEAVDIVRACLDKSPERRPTAFELAARLESLGARLETASWTSGTDEVSVADGKSVATGGDASLPQPPSGEAPQGGPPSPPPPAHPSPDEGTSITRYPVLSVLDVVRPEATVRLLIDLLLWDPSVGEASARVRIEDLPTDWSEETVQVLVHSPLLEFAEGGGAGFLRIRRSAESVPCYLKCRVSAESPVGGQLRIGVSFFCHDRFCGSVERSFEVEPRMGGSPSKQGQTDATSGGGQPSCLLIEPAASEPDLTVMISRFDANLVWALKTRRDLSDYVRPGGNDMTLPNEPHEWAASLFAACRDCPPGGHTDILEGVGELLWKKTPESFRDTYWALWKGVGKPFSIQFVSGEPFIPWELMRPVDESGNAKPILAIGHPVGRWLSPQQGPAAWFGVSGVATVAPDYGHRRDRTLPLPNAQGEGKLVAEKFGGYQVGGGTQAFKTLLEHKGCGGAASLLHFAGHGRFAAGKPQYSTLLFEDGDLPAASATRAEVVLGKQHRPMVVLNACEAGAMGVGLVGGWVEALISNSFGGVLAPLWKVGDEDAREFMEELLKGLLERNQPVGETLRAVREKHWKRSPTFLAYVYFGDVLARFDAQRRRRCNTAEAEKISDGVSVLPGLLSQTRNRVQVR